MECRADRRLIFRIAVALGRTPRELLTSVTSSELNDLLAFYHLEPFGAYRDDLRAGVVASAVYNSVRSSDDQKIWQADDFLLYRDQPVVTDQDIEKHLDQMFGAMA